MNVSSFKKRLMWSGCILFMYGFLSGQFPISSQADVIEHYGGHCDTISACNTVPVTCIKYTTGGPGNHTCKAAILNGTFNGSTAVQRCIGNATGNGHCNLEEGDSHTSCSSCLVYTCGVAPWDSKLDAYQCDECNCGGSTGVLAAVTLEEFCFEN